MNYNSTRDNSVKISAAQAISQGISTEGGLFVPQSVPTVTTDDIQKMTEMSYTQKAQFVLSKFLTDFTDDELKYCVEGAYQAEKFKSDKIAEISKVNDTTYLLELWHGPTCAFKDMALQLLPYLLKASAKKVIADKEIVILVATSGDTGKAALEGFKDVEGTRILVFYPEDGVSNMQKRQMVTQEGKNVSVCAIKGNFDDAQNGVKAIFTDDEIKAHLAKKNMVFSSANSINWGRLVPQIVYYVSSYCELLKNDEIEMGEKINVVVPTGNFGNILAAYYAKMMGIPIDKLICASNANNVLTDFINTGVYDRNRSFFTTISPSMDILISSNLERLIYILSGGDDACVNKLYADLKETGKFEVGGDIMDKLSESFASGYCDDTQTQETIKKYFDKYSYLCDTHTAVAVKVYEDYVAKTGDKTKTVIASTASPYKFTNSVLEAIASDYSKDDFEQVNELCELSGLEIPSQLADLKSKQVRFTQSVEKQDMVKAVISMLD